VGFALISVAVAVGIAAHSAKRRAADAEWREKVPGATHTGGGGVSTLCVRNGKTAAYVVAYRGDFGSASSLSSNVKTRSWEDEVTLTLKTPNGKKDVWFHCDHAAPEKLTFAGKDYNLAEGGVFLVDADGVVRQLAIETPAVEDREIAADLSGKIAAIVAP
jgi:hypothetical protein